MANFGVIENDIIVNVIVAVNKETAETVTGQTCVELPPLEVGTGWTYKDGNFFSPEHVKMMAEAEAEAKALAETTNEPDTSAKA